MKNSQAKRLSEELLNVDQKIVADTFEIDDAKKLKQYTKLKTNEAKKPFYIKPVFRRATAIAACLAIVAVTAFALTNKTNNDITSDNNSGTSSQNKKVIYVTADSPDDYSDDSSSLMSLRKKYISPALQEKMDLYKDYKEAEVVFRVTVQLFAAGEDYEEADKIADADKEVQLLFEQRGEAYLEEQKAFAEYVAFGENHPEWVANPENYPELTAECKRLVAIYEAKEETRKEISSKWDDLRREIIDEYIQDVKSKRLEFAAQFSEKEPTLVVTDSYSYYRAYNMDLTAEEIYILAEKGGYVFRFSTNDYIPGEENA